MSDTPCSVEGCRNSAAPGRRGYCWGHYELLRQRRPVDVELAEARGPHARLTSLERLVEAALVLLEVRPTDKKGWRRARNRLRMAAIRYALSTRQARPPG